MPSPPLVCLIVMIAHCRQLAMMLDTLATHPEQLRDWDHECCSR